MTASTPNIYLDANLTLACMAGEVSLDRNAVAATGRFVGWVPQPLQRPVARACESRRIVTGACESRRIVTGACESGRIATGLCKSRTS